MNRETVNVLRAMSVVGLLAMVPVSAAVQAQTVAPVAPAAPGASKPSATMPRGAMGSADMKKSMMAGMETMQKMPMSGSVDKDFAMMMKVHHQQALDMAEMELAHGQSPKMQAMAKQIIAAQKKEIAQFDRWLAKQK